MEGKGSTRDRREVHSRKRRPDKVRDGRNLRNMEALYENL